jgi:hypothetical protein
VCLSCDRPGCQRRPAGRDGPPALAPTPPPGRPPDEEGRHPPDPPTRQAGSTRPD